MRKLLRFLSSHLRPFAFFLVVPLCYLLQVTVIPYMKVGGVTPNLLLASAAVISVSYGKLRTYWASAIYGILMQVMVPSMPYFDLLIYPIVCTFTSVFFCDKSDRELQTRTERHRSDRTLHPYVRIPLCAAVNCLLYSFVNIMYVYLTGIDVTSEHYTRALITTLTTSLLALVIMLPMRAVLGFHTPPRQPRPSRTRAEIPGVR